MTETCEVYWGSHGCGLERDHDGHHFCCCDCLPGYHPNMGPDNNDVFVCVGTYPYYGPDTKFSGADARRLGLPGRGDPPS